MASERAGRRREDHRPRRTRLLAYATVGVLAILLAAGCGLLLLATLR